MSDLTQEQVKELFDYDEENGWLIRKKDERGRVVNRPCGVKPARNGYGQVNIDGKVYLTHRVVWLWHKGEWPEHEIDHIDQNKMNNRIENLRAATRSENQHNRSTNSNNSSGYPGVSFDKNTNKHKAYININSKQIYLGIFNTAEEAYLEYQLAKIQYHPTSPAAQEYLRELTMAG